MTPTTIHPAVARFIDGNNRQLPTRKAKSTANQPLSDQEMAAIQRLFQAGYILRTLQDLVHTKNTEWTTMAEQAELRRWLAMPDCQAALPILRRMDLAKENAKMRKAKAKKSKSKPKKPEGKMF